MLINTSNFICVHRALNCTRFLGLFPITSKLITKRRVIVDKQFNYKVHYLVTLFNWFTLIGALYGLYITYILSTNGKLRYAVLVGFAAGLLGFVLSLCMDYTFSKENKEWCYLINSCVKMEESLQAFDGCRTNEEIESDHQFNLNLTKMLKHMEIFCWICYLAFAYGIQLLHVQDIYNIVQEAIQPFMGPLGFFGIEDNMLVIFTVLVMIGVNLTWIFQGTCMLFRVQIAGSMLVIGGGTMTYILRYKLQRQGNTLNWNTPNDVVWHPTNARKYYQIISLIFILGMEISTKMFGCLGIIGMSLATITLYFATGSNVGLHERIMCLIAFTLANLLLGSFHLLGEVYLYSINIIDSWKCNYIGTCNNKKNRQWNIEKRQFKSYRPLKYIVGKSYAVDKLTGLRIIDAVIDKSIFMTNAFPFH